jgi:hypothetical protein
MLVFAVAPSVLGFVLVARNVRCAPTDAPVVPG